MVEITGPACILIIIGNLQMDSPEFIRELKTLLGSFPIVLGDIRKLSQEKKQKYGNGPAGFWPCKKNTNMICTARICQASVNQLKVPGMPGPVLTLILRTVEL
jgi:hypothetical protein